MREGKLRVKDVLRPRRSSLIVRSDELLINAITAFTKGSYHGIFVVDKKQRYMGRITILDIIEWAKFQLGDMSGVERNLYRYTTETRAVDIVKKYSERAFVKPNSRIVDALKWMLSTENYVLPVVEKERIVGDISLMDVLTVMTGGKLTAF